MTDPDQVDQGDGRESEGGWEPPAGDQPVDRDTGPDPADPERSRQPDRADPAGWLPL